MRNKRLPEIAYGPRLSKRQQEERNRLGMGGGKRRHKTLKKNSK
jgi:hypothetical protein